MVLKKNDRFRVYRRRFAASVDVVSVRLPLRAGAKKSKTDKISKGTPNEIVNIQGKPKIMYLKYENLSLEQYMTELIFFKL